MHHLSTGLLVQNSLMGVCFGDFQILFWMIGSTRDWLECLREFELRSTGSEVLFCQQNVRSDSRCCKDAQLRPLRSFKLPKFGDQSLHNRSILIWGFPKIGVPPKKYILMRFSLIDHPFGGTPIYGNPHLGKEQ